jgi:FtsP/CotA-like multicopper oxidase with cupredoxin domain
VDVGFGTLGKEKSRSKGDNEGDFAMAVKATVAEIRKCLVFTDGMSPIKVEPLELVPGVDILPFQVRMCNASLQLHKELDPTELWTYDGYYPGRFFFVRSDQRIAVEWINDIQGTLPVTVVESGYVALRPEFGAQLPENEPGALDGGKSDLPKPVPTPCKPYPGADALTAWTVVHLHGARVAPDSDGWTENAFLSRSIQTASQRSLYPPQARSMMLWYHDHAYTITRLNVFAGLAGGWIIRGP